MAKGSGAVAPNGASVPYSATFVKTNFVGGSAEGCIRRKALAVFAVKEVAHCLPPGLVRFSHRLALVGVHARFRCGANGFGGAAPWAAVGETGFVRLQFELFLADDADFDRECHFSLMIRRS